MTLKDDSICRFCRKGKLVKREVSQKFEREGLEVSIEGLPALVCDFCGQVYFPPGIGDRIAVAANDLFALSEIKHAGRYTAVMQSPMGSK